MISLRGWIGEKKTAFKMWLWLSKKTYHRFHNIIIPSKSGTTQIDHIIISVYGVFIVETKNKKGWIFGSENNATWTQTIYKNKYTFQNPLRQTYRQKKILSAFLDVHESRIYTVVYFVGNCSFKTELPNNVIKSRLGKYIKSFKKPVLTFEQVEHIIDILERHKAESKLTKKDHLRSLKERHESYIFCPRCGSVLVPRTSKKGPNAGSTFLGCEAFPECRFTKEL